MAFGRDARDLQAAFRATSPTISDAGRAPTDDKGRRHGYLLALSHEDENLFPPLRGEEGARRFFQARGIKWWRNSRSGDAKGVVGPTRNMASSQVNCLNFLLPFTSEPSALLTILQSLDSDVTGVTELMHGGRSSHVEFEWVGSESTLEGGPYTRGANATSIDALVVGETDRGRRAYLFEWKYVEEYSVGESKAGGSPGQTRLRRYRPLYERADSPFKREIPIEEWFFEPFYQILRMILLAERMVRDREFGIVDAKVVVVCPMENLAYRRKITSPALRERYPEVLDVGDIVRASLRRPEMFASASCAEMIVPLRREVRPDLSDWLEYQESRYGW
ncbi:hypothetical protein ACFL2T_00355 [Elusimicrobiota bacterium]